MENIFLSIIIPAYNSEKYIAECLQSVIDQELDNNLYEIIVVNDGSTDDTVDIVNQFAKCIRMCIYIIKIIVVLVVQEIMELPDLRESTCGLLIRMIILKKIF